MNLGVPGIAHDDPRRYAAFVMNTALGGGMSSRLFQEVREKRGLTYGISSSLRTWTMASLLSISTASANEKVADTIRVVRAEMTRLRNEGVTAEELAEAGADGGEPYNSSAPRPPPLGTARSP